MYECKLLRYIPVNRGTKSDLKNKFMRSRTMLVYKPWSKVDVKEAAAGLIPPNEDREVERPIQVVVPELPLKQPRNRTLPTYSIGVQMDISEACKQIHPNQKRNRGYEVEQRKGEMVFTVTWKTS